MRWFGPANTEDVTCAEIDLQVGGRWRIAFRTRDGQQHAVSGVYQEVELHKRLVFSWAWQSTPERVSLVTVALRAEKGGCTLDFLHERFFDFQARDNHERGWTGTFARLDAFISGPH
ncbi:MAG TPA: SRPBCC domain-containing protein [Ramlibacter sp.]|nr:SRPBCC domain-containing protein [Ramlibacter sp.]